MLGRAVLMAALVGMPPAARAEEFPVSPYADPSQLDVPWPKHSDYRQPWRAFVETKSTVDFLAGVGVNYHVPGNDAVAVRLLHEAGFRAFRIEVGFGSLRWEQDDFNNGPRLRAILALCRQYGIRPTMLLNAHQGVPCPTHFFKRKLAAEAPAGSRRIRLADTQGLVVGRSGLCNLSTYWAAEAFITAIDAVTGECQLSKPLPKALPAGDVAMATLSYLPLYPVGTPEFDKTAAGWTKYALLVAEQVRGAGIEEFDLEIWNELTFGTKFLDINNYYAADEPKVARPPDGLRPGGRFWEMARRTIEAVKARHPKARCLWGFSNTTFFHTPVPELPPRTDGQSYHPYGTGTRSLPQREQHPDRPEWNVERFVPRVDLRLPEGWAHLFVQTECLMRNLNPEARRRTPPGTTRFYHYMTEHGVLPAECGVTDLDAAWQLKALCLSRAMCFWLNKGIDTVHYFVAHDAKPAGFGILPENVKQLPADAKFDDVATPPLRVLRQLTKALADSEPVTKVRPLSFDVTALGPQQKIFEGDATHPPLWRRDVLALLPMQSGPGKFVVIVYSMDYDATRSLGEARYRLGIHGLSHVAAEARLYDPHTNQTTPVRLTTAGEVVEATLSVTDHPRLLFLTEEKQP